MPWYSTIRSDVHEWWIRRERFEKIMMYCILGALLVLVIVLFTRNKAPLPLPPTCQSSICLEDGARLKQSIEPDIHPCNDIYGFSCGNFWADTDQDQRISLSELKWQQVSEIASEPIHNQEHRLVQLAKKVYQACLNDQGIERDRLTTFKQALNAAGGWPIVEGDNWNEANFDWINATYKLREMGFYYSLYLVVKLQNDPEDQNKYIIQVSTADVFNYQYGFTHINFNIQDIIISIAQIFGADDRERVEREMKQTLAFWKKMDKIQHPDYYLDKHHKFTVKDYQEKSGAIDWLAFINRIIAPTAKITENDVVLFVPPKNMTKWLDLIAKTPKRIQANYMMWKLVSETVPLLNCELRVGHTGLKKMDTRENVCMAETTWRFMFNPLRIIAARRNLPLQKRKGVEELLLNIKSELVTLLTKVEWMEKEDKLKAIKVVKSLTLWAGLPVNYLDDMILDDLSVDLIENKHNGTFISLIAQANRNHESMVFKQLEIPKSESLYNDAYDGYSTPDYLTELNTLFIPDVSARKFFNEKRPNYLNYGAMGSLVGYQFGKVVTLLKDGWSEKTKAAFEEKTKCIEREMDEFLRKIGTIKWDSSQTLFLTQKAIGEQLAFAAYNNWLKKNGKELPIIAVDYTPNQLYWISSANSWCHPYFPPESTDVLSRDPGFLVKLVGVSIGNEEHFARHFNCRPGAIMNPLMKCKIF